MPRNASGVYSLPPSTAATDGQTATAAQFNDRTDDLAADMNVARPVVSGGTGATSASAARLNLGLEIGVSVQKFDAGLNSIAGLTTSADNFIYTTGSDTYAVATLTAAGRALLDDADASAQRTTLGLGSASVAALIDDDTMGTATATNVASAESVKAYTDAEVLALKNSATESPEQAISNAGTWTWAHGQGDASISLEFFAICKTAESGYSIGDRVQIVPDTSGGFQFSPVVSATNVTVRYAARSQPLLVLHATTGASVFLTNANWRLIARAKK